MLYLSEEDVKELLPMQEAIGLMRGAFEALAQGRAINQPRRRLILDTGSMLHSMAGSYGNYFGTKFYSTHPKYGAHFFFVLYDAPTAEPAGPDGGKSSGADSHRRRERVRDRSIGQSASRYARRDWIGLPGANAGRSDSRGPAHPDGARLEQERGEAAEVCRGMLRQRRWIRRRKPFAALKSSSPLPTQQDPVLEDAWIAPGTMINAMGSNVGQAARTAGRVGSPRGVSRGGFARSGQARSRRSDPEPIVGPMSWS